VASVGQRRRHINIGAGNYPLKRTTLAVVLGLALLFGGNPVTTAYADPIRYYIDCSGNDAADGTSPETAWRTLAKAQAAQLAPGDSLLFRRGCAWTVGTPQRLTFHWHGTEAAPITIGAYGAGAAPLIRADARGASTYEAIVLVSGRHLSIDSLAAEAVNPYRDVTCVYLDGSGARQGWYSGFTVTGHHITLTGLDLAHLAVGVFLTAGSHHVRLLASSFHDLDTFTRIYHAGGAFGSVGVLLQGSDNEVAGNTFQFERSATECRAGPKLYNYSTPFEVFNANRALVHHNTSTGARKHFEMGKSADNTSAGSILAYNLFVSDQPNARGPNIHGAGAFGPIDQTLIQYNTIVFTGEGSQALICSCGGGAIVTHNILIAERKAAFFADKFDERENLFWDYNLTSDPSPEPFVQFANGGLGAASLVADPLLDASYALTILSPRQGIGAFDRLLPSQATPTATLLPPSPTTTLTPIGTPTPFNTATPSSTPAPTSAPGLPAPNRCRTLIYFMGRVVVTCP
jgi:hypothetical protein